MHDIWNPWHGCVKCSEGCQNCYMYFLDRVRDKNGADIYRTQSGFRYPLSKDRQGRYKIQSGEMIRVCMTSDFFLEEADEWRSDAWDIMRMRRDVIFYLLTKRPQRVADCLPADWGDGWDNIFFNVTCEKQRRADVGYQRAKREYFARYPGGESYFDMAARIYPLIKELEGKVALLVTHGGMRSTAREHSAGSRMASGITGSSRPGMTIWKKRTGSLP